VIVEAMTAVIIKIVFFWDVKPYSLECVYESFRLTSDSISGVEEPENVSSKFLRNIDILHLLWERGYVITS
jgi:hypothetical protein